MTALILPDPIAAYFAADKQSTDAIARCFTTQAVVKDEGRTYSASRPSRRGRRRHRPQYTYTSEPFAMEQKDGLLRRHQPGGRQLSPAVRSIFGSAFRLERGLIASLEITA